MYQILYYFVNMFIAFFAKFRNSNDNSGLSLNNGLMSNPSLTWSFATNGSIYSSPTFDSYGNIFVGSSDSALYSLTNKGSLRFKYKTSGAIISSVALTSTDIYFGSYDSYLYSLNIDTGSLNWKFYASNEIISSPALSPNEKIIYIASNSGIFFAVDAKQGTKVYTIQTGGPIYSSPAVSFESTTGQINQHFIYFGSLDGYLYAVQTTENKYQNETVKGNIYWKVNINANNTQVNGIYSSPALNSDQTTVYLLAYNSYITPNGVNTNAPYLYALNALTGSRLWSYVLLPSANIVSTNTYIATSPTVSSDGTIYVISDTLNVFALSSSGLLLDGLVPSFPFAYNYGGSVSLGADSSIFILTSRLNMGSFSTKLKSFNLYYTSTQYNTLTSNRFILNPSPNINMIAGAGKVTLKCVVFGSYDGNIYNFADVPKSSGGEGGGGGFGIYNLTDIIFVLPLLLAGCFSLCWMIKVRISFYYRMRALRRERELRQRRGEPVEDIEMNIQELLQSHAAGNGTDFQRRRTLRANANTTDSNMPNYLKNNWKPCYILPQDGENLCSICFAPLFETPGTTLSTPQVHENSNPNINNKETSSFSYLSIFKRNDYSLAENNNTTSLSNSRSNGNTTGNNTVTVEEVVNLPCDHLFHKICIQSWTESHASCPICRFRPTSFDDTPNQSNTGGGHMFGVDSAFVDDNDNGDMSNRRSVDNQNSPRNPMNRTNSSVNSSNNNNNNSSYCVAPVGSRSTDLRISNNQTTDRQTS